MMYSVPSYSPNQSMGKVNDALFGMTDEVGSVSLVVLQAIMVKRTIPIRLMYFVVDSVVKFILRCISSCIHASKIGVMRITSQGSVKDEKG